MPASFGTITASPPADAGASEGGIIISAGEVAQQQEQQETEPTISASEEEVEESVSSSGPKLPAGNRTLGPRKACPRYLKARR
jgi:hypothetical protein